MNSTSRRAALLPVLLVSTSLVACGNAADADILGRAGIAVDDAGRPVAVVHVCHGTVDTVELLGDRAGLSDDEPNPVIGRWRSERGASGTIELGLGVANDGWTGQPAPELDDDRTYVLTASDSGADAEASQVSFTRDQLQDLGAGRVIVADGSVEDRSVLDDCDDE